MTWKMTGMSPSTPPPTTLTFDWSNQTTIKKDVKERRVETEPDTAKSHSGMLKRSA